MASQTAPSDSPGTFKPYKGPDSFQPEDGDFFFGRDREASHILSLVLSSRATLLHAQSGAGKTSLLNARIIPSLDAEGTLPIRVLPQNDPLKSMREATLVGGVLHPAPERLSVERALGRLNSAGSDPTLGDLLECYDALDSSDDRRRALAAPLPSSLTVGGLPVADEAMVAPFFGRLLRSTITVEHFSEQLAAVAPLNRSQHPWVGLDTRLSELVDFLGDREVLHAHEELLEELTPPVATLAGFFEQFCYIRTQHPGNLALVLILDQFEELFTRFVDPGKSNLESDPTLPDWRLRWRFFEEFEELYNAKMPSDENEAAVRSASEIYLPIRFVFSMRDEYIGQLGPLRNIVRNIDDRSYRLGLLNVSDAKDAIQKPARLYGYDYSRDCYSAILSALTKEERYVEPSHIQIVCEKLWQKFGRDLAGQAAEDNVPVIGLEQFEAMGGAAQILRSFFQDFIETLDTAEQLEILEVLEGLITGSRTRNIVEYRSLVEVPFRDHKLRSRILAVLVDQRIVRLEPRLGGQFVEITHEFLIEPILEQIQALLIRDKTRQGLIRACRILGLAVDSDFRTNVNALLNPDQFETVNEHREQMTLTANAVELMLRTAVATGSDTVALRSWLNRYEQVEVGSLDLDDLIELLDDSGETDMVPSANEWRALNHVRARIYRPPQLQAMLRAALLHAKPRERDEVVHWTRRAITYVQ